MSLAMLLSAGGWAQPRDPASAAPAPGPVSAPAAAWVGKFTGTSLSIIIEQEGGKLRGTLTRGDKTFAFTGEVKGDALAGLLDVDGSPTAFAGTIAGDVLTVKLGLDTHKLSRADASEFVGKFAGGELAIAIVQEEGGFSGTITRGGQEYPFKGGKKDGQLKGTIDVEGDQVGFAATLAGQEITLKLGLDTHKLKRIELPPPPTPGSQASNTIRKETLLARGVDVQAGSVAVSVGNRKIAFVSQRDGLRRVVINGVEGKPFARALRFTFSENGEHYFHFAERTDGRGCVVVDGVESEPCEMLANDAARISPDGKRVAFAVKRGEKWRMVVDGKEVAAGDAIQHITFSRDSRRLAYGLRKDGKWRVVIDGVEQPAYDDLGRTGIQFSADGSHIAYTAIKDARECLVIDGKEGPFFDAITDFRLTADGKRSYLIALSNQRGVLVVDGKEQASYQKPFGLSFSADGARVVVGARNDGKDFLVIDGQAQAPFDDVTEPVFSADGKVIVYAGRRTEKWRLIREGKEGNPHDEILHVAISPDGRRVAHASVDGQIATVQVDGRILGKYSEVWSGGIHFSPDGKHLVYGARRKDQWFLVVDGVEGEPVGDFVAGSRPVFDGPDRFNVLIRRGVAYHRLEATIVEPKQGK